jgi:predicted secreted Zn-dependent protease
MILQILSLLFSMLVTTSQDNLIEWSAERRLTWKDFKAQPDKNSTNAALTSSSINIEFGYNSTALKYNIKCRFDPNLSWGRIKNDYILAHEQGHFDIAEIHARKLHKTLKAYKFQSRTVSKDVNRIYDTIMKEHHELQSQYDQETNYSRNPAQQNAWKEKIETLLEDLKEFSNYH